MVVGLLDPEADLVFHALADRTRRDILTRTIAGEQSVSALARLYPMSFAAVHKHVGVLESAGLVRKRRHGREQLVSVDMDGVRRAAQLLDQIEDLWRARLDRFADVLRDDTDTEGD